MKYISKTAALCLALLVMCGFSYSSVNRVQMMKPGGNAYQNKLGKYLKALAREEVAEHNWQAADYFASRAVTSFKGNDFDPYKPTDWVYADQQYYAELSAARNKLRNYQEQYKEKYPQAVAKMSAEYECWGVRQQANKYIGKAIKCRKNFLKIVQRFDSKVQDQSVSLVRPLGLLNKNSVGNAQNNTDKKIEGAKREMKPEHCDKDKDKPGYKHKQKVEKKEPAAKATTHSKHSKKPKYRKCKSVNHTLCSQKFSGGVSSGIANKYDKDCKEACKLCKRCSHGERIKFSCEVVCDFCHDCNPRARSEAKNHLKDTKEIKKQHKLKKRGSRDRDEELRAERRKNCDYCRECLGTKKWREDSCQEACRGCFGASEAKNQGKLTKGVENKNKNSKLWKEVCQYEEDCGAGKNTDKGLCFQAYSYCTACRGGRCSNEDACSFCVQCDSGELCQEMCDCCHSNCRKGGTDIKNKDDKEKGLKLCEKACKINEDCKNGKEKDQDTCYQAGFFCANCEEDGGNISLCKDTCYVCNQFARGGELYQGMCNFCYKNCGVKPDGVKKQYKLKRGIKKSCDDMFCRDSCRLCKSKGCRRLESEECQDACANCEAFCDHCNAKVKSGEKKHFKETKEIKNKDQRHGYNAVVKTDRKAKRHKLLQDKTLLSKQNNKKEYLAKKHEALDSVAYSDCSFGLKDCDWDYPITCLACPNGHAYRKNDNVYRLGVFFPWNSARIPSTEHEKLSKIVEHMNSIHGDKMAILIGHADQTGGDKVNYKLSKKRAVSVRNALIAKGVPEHRIKYYVISKDMPVVDAPGKKVAVNRRVEVFVLNQVHHSSAAKASN